VLEHIGGDATLPAVYDAAESVRPPNQRVASVISDAVIAGNTVVSRC
jgi:hypothetical protein